MVSLNPFNEIYHSKEYTEVLKHPLVGFPYIVDIELTNYCNLDCLFCGQQTMARPRGFMSQKIFKKIVDECSKHKTSIRIIRWGEPFLHPQIIDFCRYAKFKGILLHITTNGLLITEQQMKELIEIGLDSLIFSFQGATKERYEIMRNNNQYDKLKENILKFVELRGEYQKPFIHISSTMTDETEKEINAFKNHWENIVDSVGIGKTNLSRLSIGQIKSLENMKKLELLQKQETIEKIYRPCTEVYQKLSIDWDGKVAGCCLDWDNYFMVGDLEKDTIKNIWNNSEKLKIFREMLNKGLHKSLTLCSVCFKPYGDKF